MAELIKLNYQNIQIPLLVSQNRYFTNRCFITNDKTDCHILQSGFILGTFASDEAVIAAHQLGYLLTTKDEIKRFKKAKQEILVRVNYNREISIKNKIAREKEARVGNFSQISNEPININNEENPSSLTSQLKEIEPLIKAYIKTQFNNDIDERIHSISDPNRAIQIIDESLVIVNNTKKTETFKSRYALILWEMLFLYYYSKKNPSGLSSKSLEQIIYLWNSFSNALSSAIKRELGHEMQAIIKLKTESAKQKRAKLMFELVNTNSELLNQHDYDELLNILISAGIIIQN